MKQELPSLPEHLNSPPVFSGVHVTRSLVLCVYFVDRCFFFWSLCCLFLLFYGFCLLVIVDINFNVHNAFTVKMIINYLISINIFVLCFTLICMFVLFIKEFYVKCCRSINTLVKTTKTNNYLSSK